jgi:hypothetical protein
MRDAEPPSAGAGCASDADSCAKIERPALLVAHDELRIGPG